MQDGEALRSRPAEVHLARALQLQRIVAFRMSFTLRVADIETRVLCDEPGIALTMPDPGSRFLVEGARPDVTIRVETARRLADPNGQRLFDSGRLWRLYRERDDFIFSFNSSSIGAAPYRVARFNAPFTEGTITCRRARLRDDRALEPLEYPLDELLMINLLARGRGIEVHACGVIDRDGAAYLFAGQSGAGKSTTARLWRQRGATILSDDRVILRRRAGEVWIYGTPWHGEADFAAPAAAPLARIFFLAHAAGNAARPVRGAGAAARLFACSFPPFHDRAGLDFTVDLLAAVVGRVPCAELAFTPGVAAVDFVRGLS